MSTFTVQHERRAAQRFDLHLPVSVRIKGGEVEGLGFTQDVSARGAFFYTDSEIEEGSGIELTLKMPSEITHSASMPVRCRGKVLRVIRESAGVKIGVAVYLEGYEFLPDASARDETASFDRLSGLHASSLVT